MQQPFQQPIRTHRVVESSEVDRVVKDQQQVSRLDDVDKARVIERKIAETKVILEADKMVLADKDKKADEALRKKKRM